MEENEAPKYFAITRKIEYKFIHLFFDLITKHTSHIMETNYSVHHYEIHHFKGHSSKRINAITGTTSHPNIIFYARGGAYLKEIHKNRCWSNRLERVYYASGFFNLNTYLDDDIEMTKSIANNLIEYVKFYGSRKIPSSRIIYTMIAIEIFRQERIVTAIIEDAKHHRRRYMIQLVL
jgi:hypothetical protein